MIHVMTLAFFCTGVADLRADSADRVGKFTIAAHEPARCAAEIGAVDIQLNATNQRLDVLFVQTGVGAMIAGGRAIVTGVDAGLHAFV